jgi:NAD(P)-dependent dehydrogenase (short-subunit alcohol dehydrogenase family)
MPPLDRGRARENTRGGRAMGKPRPLRGKVIVVTGGARGIGAKTAAALVREGANVAIGDLDEIHAEKTAGELGGAILALALDVTDTKAFTAFLDVVEARLGPIDVLINNAGIMPLSPLDEEDDTSTRRQLEINLHAVIHGTREAITRMRPRRTATSSTSRRWQARRDFPARQPIAPRSMPSLGCPNGASGVARHRRRSLLRDAGDRADRTRERAQ